MIKNGLFWILLHLVVCLT